jgi:pilus assembly protein CpaB
MNKRLLGVLVFAFVVSAGASLLLYRLIVTRINAQSGPPSRKLFVAVKDLNVGAMVREQDLKEVDWTGPVPANAIATRDDIVGRGVTAAIFAQEPILQNRLAAKGAGAGLASIIPPGKRAVAIRVNDVTSVAGFVTPGMRVDILMLGVPPNSQGGSGTQTKTLLQNMEVLSAGHQIEKDAEGKPITVPVVNMLVTPEQAEILSLASQDARIQLVLRNPLDKEESNTPGTAMSRLWTGAAPPPAPKPVVYRAKAPAPPPVSASREVPVAKPVTSIIVQVLHGAEKKEAKFIEKDPEE